MTQLYDNATPIINLEQGLIYIRDAVISNDATTPNTVLNVSAGIMRDSSNTYDLILGNYNGQVNAKSTANVVTVVNAAVKGLNGLDTGSLLASKVYYVYMIADPVSGLTSGVVLSLAVPSVGPLLPFGYSAYRLIGYAVTDASSHFLKMYNAGNSNARRLTYDTPQSTSISAGAATAYFGIDLSSFIPTLPINQIVQINYSYIPATAGNKLSLQPANATGAAQVITGQVATVSVSGTVDVNAQIVSAGTTPEINYKVGNSSDFADINVAGFNFYL